MGLNMIGSSSSYDTSSSVVEVEVEKVKYVQIPNPSPDNFKIIDHNHIGNFLIVLIKYEDCKNYEGNKVLVYEGITLSQLLKQKSIDPHFSNSTTMYSPIARFEPKRKAIDMAIRMCKSESI